MELSAITFMLAEAILGKVGAEVTHDSVTCDFCDYTGGGYGKAQAVAIDNGGLGKGKGDDRQAVNKHVVGHAGERGDGAAHGFVRSTQDIYSSHFHIIDNTTHPP